jgi:lysophospholipase L1-like esterase
VDYDGRPNLAQISPNSPSLYVRHHGRWQWLGIAKQVGEGPVHKLVNGPMPAALREYMLYLPLLRGMTRLEIAIPADSMIAPSRPRAEKPALFYGTSITHGGNASRPGTNHVALLERRYDYPFVNLGVSGSAQMEPEVIDLINELDACLFVIDCLPNMAAQQVRERFAPAILKIRSRHPAVPIVIVDSVIYQDAFLVTGRHERYTSSNAAQREEFAKLVAAGVPGLYYIQAHELFTDADEATVDGTHPNDAGFRLMADAFIKVLTPLMPCAPAG